MSKFVNTYTKSALSGLSLGAFVVVFAGLSVAWLLRSHADTSGLPAGVTLQQIDGGANYYCSNGFTYACNSAFNGLSWDDPRYFPIGDDYPFYPSNNPATFKDLGLNFAHRVTGSTDLTILKNAGIWAIPATGEGLNPGPETVGWHVEEPNGWAGIVSQVQENPGSAYAGRFLHISNTWNQFVYGGYNSPCGTEMPDAMSCPISTTSGNVHLDLPSADEYWFACSTTTFCQQYSGKLMYNLSSNATADQLARGSNFGDMVDQMRDWEASPAQPAPICPYIETEDGLVGTGSREITPPELNWAVWSTIVHGARCVLYFGTTSNFGSVPTFGFSQSVLPGQTVSMYSQAKATNTLIKNLAPVINAPFALHYASVTPAAYSFPTEHLTLDSGIDTMTKYYSGGSYTNTTGTMDNGFYIFSSVRGSETQTNVHATFTLADHYSGPVTVVGENRTLPATNGVFTDTFAKSTDAHIYQIPYAGVVSPTPTATTSAGPTPTSSPSAKIGDINNDGAVNIFDLSILLSKWSTSDPASDLNHDGPVNVFDLSILLSHWAT